jgi:pyruvate formate lyase activating enzyme
MRSLINFNKIEPISTVDYPGKSACVIFLNGCPLRCGYCHNKQTWAAINMINIKTIEYEILKCLPFISAVVFSGGEPTMQIESLIELCKFSKDKNLFVGIETSGYYPENLLKLKPYVDIFFIDIKARIDCNVTYHKVTGNIDALKNINKSLNMDIPIEIRIVDIGNTQDIIKSLNTKHKITILPYNKISEQKYK